MIWNTPSSRLLGGACLLFSALVLPGCGGSDTGSLSEGESMSQILGSVVYRERMMLPPGSELEIQLQDVSRADAPASVLASVMIRPDGGPPYSFSIDYNPGQIDERMRYALRATIRLNDRLLFTNTDYIDAFGGNPVEVLVRRVPETVVSTAGPDLLDTNWRLETLSGEPAKPGAGGRQADLKLVTKERRVGGFSGCNRFTGAYESKGDATHGTPLSFGPLAGTMMACAEGGELEQQYLQMLAAVSAYRLEGEILSLLHGDQVVATFRAE